MPGFESSADGRPGIAGNGLHENILVSRAVFERRHQQGVQPHAAGQAEVASRTGHADNGYLHGPLDPRGHMWAQILRNRVTVHKPKAIVEARTESAEPQALGSEIRAVD